jgi:hypothetical protein
LKLNGLQPGAQFASKLVQGFTPLIRHPVFGKLHVLSRQAHGQGDQDCGGNKDGRNEKKNLALASRIGRIQLGGVHIGVNGSRVWGVYNVGECMRVVYLVALAMAVVAIPVLCQSPAGVKPSFEVATIKPGDSGQRGA